MKSLQIFINLTSYLFFFSPSNDYILEKYIQNLTISYPGYIVESQYYWTTLSFVLCLGLFAFGAFNLFKLFTNYNIFRTLQMQMFWNTITIGSFVLPPYLTLFCNKLALIVVTACAIAMCFFGWVRFFHLYTAWNNDKYLLFIFFIYYFFKPNYSQAFEVWINTVCVWSGLKTGSYLTLDGIHTLIQIELPRILLRHTLFGLALGIFLISYAQLEEFFQPKRLLTGKRRHRRSLQKVY